MNVNLHYKSQFWILGLGRIFNRMPAEIAKDILETKLREFGVLLNDDIVALVTDGASVMIKMGKLFNAMANRLDRSLYYSSMVTSLSRALLCILSWDHTRAILSIVTTFLSS